MSNFFQTAELDQMILRYHHKVETTTITGVDADGNPVNREAQLFTFDERLPKRRNNRKRISEAKTPDWAFRPRWNRDPKSGTFIQDPNQTYLREIVK